MLKRAITMLNSNDAVTSAVNATVCPGCCIHSCNRHKPPGKGNRAPLNRVATKCQYKLFAAFTTNCQKKLKLSVIAISDETGKDWVMSVS